jgi:isopenicillin-N epimerase
LAAWMLEKHRIVVTPIAHKEFDGLRVTPNVYTTLAEIDLFAERMIEAARKGLA